MSFPAALCLPLALSSKPNALFQNTTMFAETVSPQVRIQALCLRPQLVKAGGAGKGVSPHNDMLKVLIIMLKQDTHSLRAILALDDL